jgi:hypothetical protein
VRTRFEARRVSPIAEPAGHVGNAEFTDYWALKNSNLTEARYVRPGGNVNSSKPGLTLSERRFQEFDEFLFRVRPAIKEWVDGASETASSRGLGFEESEQAPANVADC